MKGNLRRLKQRKETIRTINDLMDRPDQTVIIHYSSQDFKGESTSASPRVTSIGVRYLASGQTHSFSIHLSAEKLHIQELDIQNHLDKLEKDMLDSFYKFVREHQLVTWVHWNMRDTQYGFAAIEHRYSVLNETPTIIPDNHKHDLARSLVTIYGTKYMNHPRLQNLMMANNISAMGFLAGDEEAAAFENGEYLKMHCSTLRKIDSMENVLERVANQTLVTHASMSDIYGTGVRAGLEWFQDHPSFLILGILGGIASIVSLLIQLAVN